MKSLSKISFFAFLTLLTLILSCPEILAMGKRPKEAKPFFKRKPPNALEVTWLERGQAIHTGGFYGRWLKVDGKLRHYKFFVPSDFKDSGKLRVVFMFHGGGGHPGSIEYRSGFSEVAERDHFVVVYGAGTYASKKVKPLDRWLVWNSGVCCGNAAEENINDVKYVDRMIEDLSHFLQIDRHRLYATGFSNGSLMTFRLAEERSRVFAAVAPVGAVQKRLSETRFARKIPLLYIHGLQDKNMPFEGGLGQGVSGYAPPAVSEVIEDWRQFNECSENPEISIRGSAIKTYYSCSGETELITWTIQDGGHTWPGGKQSHYEEKTGLGHINRDISATEEIWRFFSRHSLK